MDIRLFGPLYEDVADCLREPILAGLIHRLWFDFPEVRLITQDNGVVKLLRQKFGNAIFTTEDEGLASVTGKIIKNQGLTLATAESCTGGLVSDILTNIPGSSEYFTLGVVSYSNQAKTRILGVEPDVLKENGAVSKPVVRQMLSGITKLAKTDCGIAISGVAGPSGGSTEKPVGTVFIGVQCRGEARIERFNFDSDRRGNKVLSAYTALNMLRLMVQKGETDVIDT